MSVSDVLRNAVESGKFLIKVTYESNGNTMCRQSDVKILRKKSPQALIVRITELDEEDKFENLYVSVLDEEHFLKLFRKKRFSGSASDFMEQVKALVESCAVHMSKRELRLVERNGNLFLEVVEAGAFKAVALISLPTLRVPDSDALIILNRELNSFQEMLRSKKAEDRRLELEISASRQKYVEEMEKLRLTESELKDFARSREAQLEEERRERMKARAKERSEKLKVLKAQLEEETACVKKLESYQASLSRKTEVIALEKSEVEDAIKILRQQREMAAEAQSLGMKEADVLKSEINAFHRQIETNAKILGDLDDQLADWHRKTGEIDRQMCSMEAEEQTLRERLKRRTDVAQRLSEDLLASSQKIHEIHKDCNKILVRINSLEKVGEEKGKCIAANSEILEEGKRCIMKLEAAHKREMEEIEARTKDTKLAELEREVKINREVIAVMDKKLEQAQTTKETSPVQELHRLYGFTRPNSQGRNRKF